MSIKTLNISSVFGIISSMSLGRVTEINGSKARVSTS